MIEQKIKSLFGEYTFTIAALQEQIELLQQQVDTCQKELEECKKPTKKQ